MVTVAEQQEPEVALRQMTDGHNVIEDYSHTGLTLRQHPVAFLRKDLSARNIITCAEAMIHSHPSASPIAGGSG